MTTVVVDVLLGLVLASIAVIAGAILLVVGAELLLWWRGLRGDVG